MRSRRGMGNRPCRFIPETCLYAATIVVAILAMAGPVTVYGQAGGLPFSLELGEESPDPGDVPTEPTLTEAEKAAAVNALMTNVVDTPEGLGPKLGMQNPRQEWIARKISKSQQNGADVWHFKLDQVFQGIRVVDGHLSINMPGQPGVTPREPIRLDDAIALEEGGTSTAGNPTFHGDYHSIDPGFNTNPVISKQQAMRIVRRIVREESGRGAPEKAEQGAPQQLRVETPDDERADLEIMSDKEGHGRHKLTYHVVVSGVVGSGTSTSPTQLHAWVGAQADVEGQILRSYDNIQTVHPQPCTGNTFYQGQILGSSGFTCAFWPTYNVYVLNDNALRIGAYDSYSSCSATYQASSSTSTFGNFALSNRNSTNADTYWATVQTMSYYYYNHGRNYVDGNYGPKVYSSVDGLGALLSARNHVCSNYNNAYWDGQKINIGDGDGGVFRSLATLDIIGHEWTHGVTQFVAGLIYSGESGALNESFSDIFGAMAERYWKGQSGDFGTTWQIGEGAFTPGTNGDALRYMYRPTLDGNSRDHYSQRYTGTADNGGVHWNSGIQNNAFWLLATGQCHRFSGCMSGSIGADAAKTIFYLALRDYLIPTDGFYWARYGTQYEAGVLYGFSSFQYNRTKQAWDLVGAPQYRSN